MYFTALAKSKSMEFIAAQKSVAVGQRFQLPAGTAFAHDITKGIPPEYFDVDMIWTEVAWARGLKKFNESSKIEQTFDQYMTAIARFALKTSCPMFVVAGKEAANYLASRDYEAKVTLNGNKAVLYVWRFDPMTLPLRLRNEASSEMYIYHLAEKFMSIGDPCCGLGRTGRIFAQEGKRFVMSDYNAKAIAAIVNEMTP